MSANTFELIEEPSSIPLTLDDYHTQNKILKEMRFLHTAFDGIKLAISDKYKPPIILKGSICPFCYSIFEAKEDIILEIASQNHFHQFLTFSLLCYMDLTKK